jgi:hypothetical protein
MLVYKDNYYNCVNKYTHYVHNENANEYENVQYSIKTYGINLLIFEGIDCLNISAKYIKYLKNIPSSVQVVKINCDNFYGQINLKHLENTQEGKPNSIKKIVINCIEEDELTVDKIINLPKGIESLEINECGGHSFSPNFFLNNQNLIELKLFNSVENLDNLPDSLKKLSIVDCRINNLDNLPSKLEELKIQRLPVGTIDFLPASLKILEIRECDITNFDNLPNVTKLSLTLRSNNSNNYILDKLPDSLTTLYFNCDYNSQVDLSNIPSSVEELFCSCKLIGFIPTNNIKVLKINIFSTNELFYKFTSSYFPKITDLDLDITISPPRICCLTKSITINLNMPNLESLKIKNSSFNKDFETFVLTNSTKLDTLITENFTKLPAIFYKKFSVNKILGLCKINKLLVLFESIKTPEKNTFDMNFNFHRYISEFGIEKCYDEQLTLPDYLVNLKCIKAINSKYMNINMQNLPNISEINCSNNNIESLENLPSSLINLNCSRNPIKTITNIPKNLQHIIVDKKFNINTPEFNSRLGSLTIEKVINYFDEDEEEEDEEEDEEDEEEDEEDEEEDEEDEEEDEEDEEEEEEDAATSKF